MLPTSGYSERRLGWKIVSMPLSPQTTAQTRTDNSKASYDNITIALPQTSETPNPEYRQLHTEIHVILVIAVLILLVVILQVTGIISFCRQRLMTAGQC